jgi:phosphate-selective porin OprO/OprP
LTVDDKAFEDGYADAKKSAKSADAVGGGVNWYLSSNARFSLDYEQTAFDGGASTGDRPDEKVVIARAQVAF